MKYIAMIIVLVSLVGCGLFPVSAPLRPDGLPTVTTAQEAADWVWNNIEYTKDREQYGFRDYWASPEQTLESGKGDCEDYALLFLYIVKMNLDIEGTVEVSYYPEFGIYHAYGVADGAMCYWESGYEEDYIMTYSYDEAMAMVGFSF
jgi:hypothetical protein